MGKMGGVIGKYPIDGLARIAGCALVICFFYDGKEISAAIVKENVTK